MPAKCIWQASPAGPKHRSTAQPFDRSHAPAWERHPDAPASPNRQHPSPGGVLFFACPKKRTRRVVCATPLRKGSPAAETTPVAGLRNRRGKNSLRSDSLPLVPGSAPRRPAQRQRAVFLPRKLVLLQTILPAGPAPHLVAGDSEGERSHAGAWERSDNGSMSIAGMARPKTPDFSVGAGHARDVFLIVSTLQRHPDSIDPLAGRRSFLCLPKEKNQKKGQPCR